MIRQLCYLSFVSPECRETDIAGIAEHAAEANAAAGLTGLLAYGGRLFFQVLEGPRDCVQAAFVRIRRDSRHGALRVLQDEMISGHDFEHWPMAFRRLSLSEARRLAMPDVDADQAIAVIVSCLETLLPGPVPTFEAERLAA